MTHDTFQIVVNIRDLFTRLPPQTPQDQPVYITDPFNKTASFHLNFICSADVHNLHAKCKCTFANLVQALVFVLKEKFRDIDRAVQKVDSGEFIIQDAGTKRVINLRKNWNQCFSPGQHVTMSMMIWWDKVVKDRCSNCDTPCPSTAKQEIQCSNCGVYFHSIIRESKHPPATLSNAFGLETSYVMDARKSKIPNPEQEVKLFRRIRVSSANHPFSQRHRRRKMLSDELSDDLRRNLIWERQNYRRSRQDRGW